MTYNVFSGTLNPTPSPHPPVLLRLVTIPGYTVLVRNQPSRPTQPPILSRKGNEYQPSGSGSALQLGR